MTEHKSILHEAADLISNAKREAYGPVEESFDRIAALARILLPYPITREEVATFMICVKLARQHAKHSRDNLVDLCGYAALLQHLLDKRPEEQINKPSMAAQGNLSRTDFAGR